MKKIITATIVTTIFFAGCGSPEAITQTGKIKITASFYPLAEFARNIGGDKVEVATVTPPGSEPHDYEPTPRDLTKIRESKILLLNGGGQDEWGERIQDELEQNGLTVINMSEHIDLVKSDTGEAQPYDPHFWLDPILAAREVEFIRDALIKIDPENSDEYQNGAREYMKTLSSLDYDFGEGLKNCKTKDFITSHKAFAYLAKRYGLHQIAIAGFSPEEEPSPKQLGDLAQLAKEKGIEYIFFETLISPKLAETLATEIGAKTLVLNPIEGLTADEMAAGENYVTLMQENLTNLRIALHCE